MKIYSIAIDGPAGSGKSTVAKILSEKLGIVYVDTGAMYRTAAYYCMTNGIDTKDGVFKTPVYRHFPPFVKI